MTDSLDFGVDRDICEGKPVTCPVFVPTTEWTRDQIFGLLQSAYFARQNSTEFDLMAREFLAVLFDTEIPITKEDMQKLPESISIEQMLRNAFEDFQVYYSR